ncbi:NAD kinase [Vagococcus xieshaowenii]|uniref:NAD kinase n=1 Tax=Vagococcus xieshaowenii TaxID=2562451 RepID=A0A4Z0D8K9_9ENTE|nr:NAD kinase [Vagococcus xieshaowenii]QCA28008.1 NAD kinase [Vagococcus xieshaowenii]TFZ41225.1 NAD kinase [Vagococcus xieshaowenii]
MRIAVFASDTDHSQLKKRELEKLIIEKGLTLDNQTPETVITIGGDGTLLSAFHRFVHRLDRIRFIGIHTGHLGFYTDWRDFELEELVDSLLEIVSHSVSYPLLEIKVTYCDDQEPKHFLALNECVIRRVTGTMRADVYIKDELFEQFRGDGLSVSTPTGSTAYNKSVGGAVLHPSVNALQLAEIASINNRVYRTLGSPLVIGQEEWIAIAVNELGQHMLSIDHLVMAEENVEKISYRVAQERIHFGGYRHNHFWTRVKDAFIK